jgi:hypothetical protein
MGVKRKKEAKNYFFKNHLIYTLVLSIVPRNFTEPDQTIFSELRPNLALFIETEQIYLNKIRQSFFFQELLLLIILVISNHSNRNDVRL